MVERVDANNFNNYSTRGHIRHFKNSHMTAEAPLPYRHKLGCYASPARAILVHGHTVANTGPGMEPEPSWQPARSVAHRPICPCPRALGSSFVVGSPIRSMGGTPRAKHLRGTRSPSPSPPKRPPSSHGSPNRSALSLRSRPMSATSSMGTRSPGASPRSARSLGPGSGGRGASGLPRSTLRRTFDEAAKEHNDHETLRQQTRIVREVPF